MGIGLLHGTREGGLCATCALLQAVYEVTNASISQPGGMHHIAMGKLSQWPRNIYICAPQAFTHQHPSPLASHHVLAHFIPMTFAHAHDLCA